MKKNKLIGGMINGLVNRKYFNNDSFNRVNSNKFK